MFSIPTFNRIGHSTVRYRDGREYLVAPVVLARAIVMNGSSGPIYYPARELRKDPKRWNNIPLTIGHPEEDGLLVSAKNAGRHIGFVDNVYFQAGGLRGEAWIDIEATPRAVLNRINSGKPTEVSTGLFTQVVPESGVHGHRSYSYRLVGFEPDHLAVLIKQVGACSVEDGCGVVANSSRGIVIGSGQQGCGVHGETPLELPQLFA